MTTEMQLELTLLWPLATEERDAGARAAPLNLMGIADLACARLRTCGWLECDDLLFLETPSTDRSARFRAHQEFVYFHPFIQRFLYGADSTGERRDWRVFTRNFAASDHLCFQLFGLGEIKFSVGFCRAYMTDMGVTVVALNLRLEKGACTTVQHAETVLDQVRRAYAPYWKLNKAEIVEFAGHCPTKAWWEIGGRRAGESAFSDLECNLKDFAENPAERHPPFANHWAWLLDALHSQASPIRLRHLEDERIPLMAHIAVENPFALTDQDFTRLAYADESGGSNYFPYSEDFAPMLVSDEIAYDRFWYPKAREHPDAIAEPEHWYNDLHTRHLCTGNVYIILGKAGDGHFCDAHAGDLLTFRQLYFQLGLIAHFYKASMLKLSDLIAKVIKAGGVNAEKRTEFRRDVQHIYNSFLFFTHRYWFDDLTNQIQGQELFAYWKRHLKLREMYEQLANELRTINNVIDVQQQTTLSEQQTGLSALALRAVPLAVGASVAVGLLGANGLLDTKEWGPGLLDPKTWAPFSWQWLGVFVYIVVGLITGLAAHWGLSAKVAKTKSH